jgi:energy-coupling factor transporter ATP-binding protein EcfA2/uncharacterized membrane protein
VESEIFRLEDVSFTYPGRARAAISGVSLSIRAGGFAVVCGASGCGKTTLLRCLKPSVTPGGSLTGGVYFRGTPAAEHTERGLCAGIGFVSQSPENQIVTDTVWRELAFGLECLGAPPPVIRLRVAETASFFGIGEWFGKKVSELSGGQKQILNLASVMAAQPDALILDEPTSQLDPVAASNFLGAAARINRELGVTVIMTEHRLEDALPLADHLIVMDGGAIVAEGAPRDVAERIRGDEFCVNQAKFTRRLFRSMPTAARIWASVPGEPPCPMSAREGREWLAGASVPNAPPVRVPAKPGETAVSLRGVWFRYGKDAPDALADLTLEARYGEITAVMGGNGAGKSTALAVCAGLALPYRGRVSSDASVALLPQDPTTLFTRNTVRGELEDAAPEGVDEAAEACGLTGLMDVHPYDLSGGERQLAALAKVLLTRPRVLLLDEPTKGLDAAFKDVLAGILRRLASDGAAVMIVSHDAEFCAEHADRCVMMFRGSAVSEGAPVEFFSGSSFYTTAANRISRGIIPGAVTAGDVIAALGGSPEKPAARLSPPRPTEPENAPPSPSRPKGRLALYAASLCAVPPTLLAGLYLMGDRKYYFISLMIMLETSLPFALSFERRGAKPRELILVAALTAIAAAGRAAFFMTPQFKPTVAVVIIAGSALGGELGFMTGAAAAFVSNMFFGQGPWTPWQMFAMGIIGLLSGILFGRQREKNRFVLAAFGAAAAFVVYGGIMNTQMALTADPNPTAATFAAAFAGGAAFDAIHGAATAFFLAVAAGPMLAALRRVKAKYME